jgi:hypothetical protein
VLMRGSSDRRRESGETLDRDGVAAAGIAGAKMAGAVHHCPSARTALRTSACSLLFFFFFFFLNSAPFGFGLDTNLVGSPYYAKQPRVISPKPRERMLLRTPSYVAVWGSRLLEQSSQCQVFRRPYTH